VRQTLRQLRTSPAFTAAAVVTLALGIGATTAIFTLVHQVMLRSLPVARPGELWRIGDVERCCHATGYKQRDWNFFSWELYKHFRANTPAFQELTAFQMGTAWLALRRAGSPAPVQNANGEFVSGNFFATFGISAWRGRLLTDDDDREGAAPVAAISFHTWQDKYGSDPSVVGATYQINGQPFTIVGVAAPGFFGAKIDGSTMPDFWLPLATEPAITGTATRLRNNGEPWLNLIGRIRRGENPKAVEAQLQVELHQWLASHVGDMIPQEKAIWQTETLHLTPGGAGVSLMRENYKDSLRLLLLAALCVLLVAGANTANLLLARGLKERPQTALRAALGASRGRLMAKALRESVTLAVIGGALGIAVAYAGARLLLYLSFNGWTPVDAAPSIPVLLFALGISLATAIVFGIAPAWMTSHVQPIEALRGANRSTRGSRQWAQRTLVAVQAGLSLVLLSAAAMLGRSLWNMERQNFGFETGGRYVVEIDPKLSGYKQEQLVALTDALEERVRAIPGVRMAGSALYAPLTGYYWDHDIRIEGEPDPSAADSASSAWTRVTPGFFATLGDRVVMGRPFGAEDNAGARPVAIVNQAFAKRFFGRDNPVGRHFGPAPRKNAGMYEIVGVASDMQYFSGGGEPVAPMYFLPGAQSTHFDEPASESREQWSHYLGQIVIWAPGDPPGIEANVRKALAAFDPNLLVDAIRPYSKVIDAGFGQEKTIATLTWLFGALGLVLAAVGLYGVTAYGVEQRSAEIGVRMALGADRGSVVAMVLRGAFRPVGIGLALGIPAAIGAGRLISSRLYRVAPWDPLLLAGAAVALVTAALFAAAIPARRAASVDPVRALKAK
jgi:predicted permease